MLVDRITALSGERIEVRHFPAGEFVPGCGVFDAVSKGTAKHSHVVPAYWGCNSIGILPLGSQPFSLRADEQFVWLYHSGGQALYDEMNGRFGIKPFLSGPAMFMALRADGPDAGEFIGPRQIQA